MAQYLLSVHMDDNVEAPAPEEMEQAFKDVDVLNQKIQDTGAWVFAGGLHDASTATVLQVQDGGEVLITDGPYTEGKEHLGGFTVVEAPDLDAALHWARKQVEITGLPTEVRPFR